MPVTLVQGIHHSVLVSVYTHVCKYSHRNIHKLINKFWAGKMAEQVKGLAAKADGFSLTPKNCMVEGKNCLFQAVFTIATW